MPHIEEKELLSLHYQIEKAEIEQQKASALLDKTSKDLQKNNVRKNILEWFCVALAVIAVGLIYLSYSGNLSEENSRKNNQAVNQRVALVDSLKKQLAELREEKVNLEEIKALYLYRSLINKETVYSVQLKSFVTNKTSLISDKFTNMRFYNDTSYYKYSLGIFETLEEAQHFRKTLIELGFNNNIFVISYKNGKRLKIEDSEIF